MDRRLLLKTLACAALPSRVPPRQTGREEASLPWADAESAPGGPDGARFTDLSRLRGPTVPTDQFFVLHHGGIPRLRPETFRLSLSGEVKRAETFTLDELRALEKTERTVCFECAGNGGVGMHGLVGSATWGGVRLSRLLDTAGLRPGAREVVFHGADTVAERLRGNEYPARFARSLPIADASGEEAEVLLAYEMNGEPLSEAHGFPLRLIVPGWYGIAQVKWLTHIEVSSSRFMGWFMAKDYVTIQGEEVEGRVLHRATSVGRQRLKSIVTRVSRSGGEYAVHGYAWNEGTKVVRVDLHVDGALKGTAALEPPASRFAWTPFRWRWEEASPGEHALVSVAHDAGGRQRTPEEASRYKATPWENDGQVVRRIILPGLP